MTRRQPQPSCLWLDVGGNLQITHYIADIICSIQGDGDHVFRPVIKKVSPQGPVSNCDETLGEGAGVWPTFHEKQRDDPCCCLTNVHPRIPCVHNSSRHDVSNCRTCVDIFKATLVAYRLWSSYSLLWTSSPRRTKRCRTREAIVAQISIDTSSQRCSSAFHSYRTLYWQPSSLVKNACPNPVACS